MAICETLGCDDLAEYYDDGDNKLCHECMQRDIDEGTTSAENFETIESVERAINSQ